MKDVMIDFETFGKGINKAICQVGACYFDKTTGEIGKKARWHVDARTHEKLGGVLDADTVYWWLTQSDEARKSLVPDEKSLFYSIEEAMGGLNVFLADADRIWSHATFDFVTLTDTLRALGIKPLFPYKAGMDLRTLTYLAKVSPQDFTRDGIHHDGLEDAIFQVKYCVAALNKIQGDRSLVTKLKGFLSG